MIMWEGRTKDIWKEVLDAGLPVGLFPLPIGARNDWALGLRA